MTAAEMTDILDIKPLIEPELWPWLLGSALFFLFIIILITYVLYRKRNRHSVGINRSVKIENPIEEALRKWAELDASGLLEREQYRKYYFELSDIVKNFLQRKYSVEALEATTEEILPRLKNCSELSEDLVFKFKEVLLQMDQVKFARVTPTHQELELLRSACRALFV